jgi:hypothetical protein
MAGVVDTRFGAMLLPDLQKTAAIEEDLRRTTAHRSEAPFPLL